MAAPASLFLHPCTRFSLTQPKNSIFSKPNHHPSPSPSPSPSSSSSSSSPLHFHPTSLSTHRSPPFTHAVSISSDQLNSPPPTQQEQKRRYYFLVANAKFMLDEEEHFQELMNEKLRMYGERNKEVDFWLVIEPKFLDRFPNVTKRLKRPAVALVSTDANWITFMKLRLDRVLAESFEADSFAEAMASNPVDLQFEKPKNWVAPYPKYEFGWWEAFLPKETSKTAA